MILTDILIHEPFLKVLLVGDTDTGKSQFLNQYVNQSFCSESLPTIGCDFKVKRVIAHRNLQAIKLQISDTAGTERFRAITKYYYLDTQIVVLFVDVTKPLKLQSHRLEQLISDIKENAPQNVPVMVVMSKCDCEKKFDKTQLKQYLTQLKLSYYEPIHEISAKESLEGTQFDKALTEIAEKTQKQCTSNHAKPLENHCVTGYHLMRTIHNHPYKAMILAGAVLGVVLCAIGVFTPFGTAALSIMALGIIGGGLFGLTTFIVKSAVNYKSTVAIKAKLRQYLLEQKVLPTIEIQQLK